MKSNEEFIAGIYEKAAVYTEEKESKEIRTVWVAKATRIAAMAAVCIGLAGIGSMVLGNGNGVPDKVPQPDGNYGIALTSDLGEDAGDAANGIAQLRIGPTEETVTFTGVVESIDVEEKRIRIKLIFDETVPASVKDSMVCIKWDMLDAISEDVLVGTTLTATGVLSEHNGCAELVLTDIANLVIK